MITERTFTDCGLKFKISFEAKDEMIDDYFTIIDSRTSHGGNLASLPTIIHRTKGNLFVMANSDTMVTLIEVLDSMLPL